MLNKKNLSIFLNSAIVLLELIGFVITFIKNGPKTMLYYTQDSNLILLVACGLYLFYVLRKKEVPEAVKTFKFIATCMVTLTFFVVVTILAPMTHSMVLFYRGSNFEHHVICPILAVVVFLVFEEDILPTGRDLWYSLIPTLIYAVVFVILNFAKVVDGPYPFLRVYRQPWYMSVMWFILIPGAALGFAALLRVIKLKTASKRLENR